MRIFRTLILLTGAGLLLPSPPEGWRAAEQGAPEPSTLELLTSAGAAASDAASFCSRQPEVCSVAGYLTEKLTAKALYSASLVWGWAERDAPQPAEASGPFAAISVAGDVPDALPAEQAGQSTLGLDDLIPEWRGPQKGG
ncbi:MAG: DUF5330 domain-containing protein [Aestuariivirga sp.]|uniref:DUF5330 domain-containing protein n=1 Tax=Aestuariivirga sp. TaxID=2650926 RepID=UPI0038CFBE82